jgi:hypothetical protein
LFEIHDRNASGLESGQSRIARGRKNTHDVKDIGSASKRSPVKATNICRDIPSSPSPIVRRRAGGGLTGMTIKMISNAQAPGVRIQTPKQAARNGVA